jgi:tetratricopeptide (TPR) repeat protein
VIDANGRETRVRAVADQDRKGRKADDDAADEAERKSPTPEADEAKGDADEAEAKGDADEAGESKAEGEADDDEAARRVAAALGVEGEESEEKPEGEGAEAAEEAPAPNRAQRRAEAARRRKKREGDTVKADADADAEALPKDRNARARELLKRRREQAAEAKPPTLMAGEMVDDALARTTSAIGKWLRQNGSRIQWVIVGALVVGGGYLFYESRVQKTAAAASDALAAGVDADLGVIKLEDKRSDEEKAADPTKVFKNREERTEAAMAAYKKVLAEHPNTGAAILARLGEAGDLLDKREWDRALEAYSAVASSTLAAADSDVKGRAVEGMGFAKEGKGDLAGAMAAFKELQSIEARGFKELGMYQEARILLAQGEKDKAKDLLKQVREKLQQPSTEGKTFAFLEAVVDEALRRIDPSLVPPRPALGGPKGNALSAEELERIRKMLRDAAEKKQPHQDQH